MELDDLLRLVSVPSLLGGGGDPLAAYHALISSLNPTLWGRFDEASGNLINYGADGNSAAVSGSTQGQTGQLGTNEAYLFDGVDDILTFANAGIANTLALTTQRWMFLVNASSLGEGNAGTFWTYSSFSGLGLRFSANNVLRAGIDLATDASAISNNNQVDFIGSWALVFADYDDANSLGLGRKIRLMRATAASPTTLLTLATDTAGVGTVGSQIVDLYIGNRGDSGTTFAGLQDEMFLGSGLWSPAGTPADLTLPDSIRSAVFGV